MNSPASERPESTESSTAGPAAVGVRPAAVADCAAIADIYRHYVLNTVATFDYRAPTAEQWTAKLDLITRAGRPFVVAESPDGEIAGFAYLGTFRAMPAYDRTTEDTIYVHPDLGGRGIGSALMTELLARTDRANVRQIIAVIAANGGAGSIALHRRFGFAEVGRLRDVGHKAGSWIDCVYLQLDLWSGTEHGNKTDRSPVH